MNPTSASTPSSPSGLDEPVNSNSQFPTSPLPSPPALPTQDATSAKSKATSSTKAIARSSKERFDNDDISTILTWLEHPPNFTKIYGASGQSSVGMPVSTSMKGWDVLAAHLNKKSKGHWAINGRNMRDRFGRLKKKYTDARDVIKNTGFGITEEDRLNGIHRMEHKKESLCFGFDRFEELFGHKPNVEPLVELDASISLSVTTQRGLGNMDKSGESEGEEEREFEEGEEADEFDKMREEINQTTGETEQDIVEIAEYIPPMRRVRLIVDEPVNDQQEYEDANPLDGESEISTSTTTSGQRK
ncbi:hypothetical protein BGZ76_004661 [Entomortierella beljakovae]|nr:hypothetical protein BGZ76_004661 [Entomortierella beljakovae]